MYKSDLHSAAEKMLALLGVSAALALAIACVCIIINHARDENKQLNVGVLFGVALVFGCLALVTGLITGASRTAAAGQVLPAALGLIGAVAMYTVTQKPDQFAVAATAVIAFSLMLVFGTVLGSYERARAEAFAETKRYNIQILRQQADIEAVINGYRKSKSLPPIDFLKE